MKRATALKNATKIADRLRGINGIYCSPLCDDDFLKVKRVWLFGSTAKGSENPNDLDIFVELLPKRSYRRKGRDPMFRNNHTLHGSYKPRKSNRSFITPTSARDEFAKWLRKNMPRTSIHFVDWERDFFEQLDCKKMIYPINTLDE